LIFLAGILTLGGSLQAATSYMLDFNSTSSAGLTQDGSTGFYISPYTGTVNDSTVKLYCDDFNDNITWGQQNISVYSTALTATTNTAFQQDTRYGVNNASNAGLGYPSGTQLYEEMAWLATQMQNTTGTHATGNDIAIQEAIWALTNNSTVNDGLSPHTYSTAGTGTFGDNGVQQSYLQWITDASSNYNKTGVTGYTDLTIGNWYIITAVASAGCTYGSEGTLGCSGAGGTGAGTHGTGTVTQEFLAYSANPIATSGGSNSTPEPASFLLIGSGLLVGGLFSRRRKLNA
jgi:hypothetical protein